MAIKFDARDVLNILRDTMAYILVQHRNDELGQRLLDRISKIVVENDELIGD